MRLWRRNPATVEGKYLVTRRDGTVPEWPWFVLGGEDPAAVAALRAYADRAEELGYDPLFVQDIRDEAARWLKTQDEGDRSTKRRPGRQPPDGKPHRKDDPETIAKMRRNGN